MVGEREGRGLQRAHLPPSLLMVGMGKTHPCGHA